MEKEKLKRELRQEALLRMEKAARTEAEYTEVVQMYDKLDDNRERKERYHEISCPHDTMYRAPDPYYHDFLDLILDDVDWFHHMVEDADVSANIGSLLKMQKDVLYLYKVRVLKVKQIAAMLGKTDRTIRKRRGLLLARLRERLAPRITARIKSGPPITPAMRKFIENYGKEGGA